MTIGTWELARLGRECVIPQLFQRAWVALTNENPVATVITYEHIYWQTRISDRVGLTMVIGGFSLMAIILLENPFLLFLGRELIFGNFEIFLAITAGLCVLAGVAVAYRGSRSFPNLGGVPAFCNDLNALLGWTNWKLADIFLLEDQELKKKATELMVPIAAYKLQLQAIQNPGEEVKGRIAELEEEIKSKYLLLERLGLASGGWGKFYAKGKRRLAAEEAKAALERVGEEEPAS